MPKPKIPNQRKAQLEHKKRIERYVALINQLYDKLNKEASKLALMTDHDPAKQFLWRNYPQTKAALNKLQSQYISEMSAIIMAGTSAEWKESNLVQDLVAKKLLKAYTGTTKAGEEYTRYFETDPDALKAFQQRKAGGMNLSQRVWNLSEQYKTELEMAISAAIEPGTSAMELAADIKKYLNEPDMMFRRFRYKDENGEWRRKWKQKVMGGDGKVYFIDADPKEYHPGRGVYRSSARNAQRLARTEINMSYSTAEQERWRQFDFVVGYEVKTTQNGHHVTDICDTLAGKYPKTFQFTGWHPQCMCYCIPILKTEDEFWADDDVKSVNEVTYVPQNFKEWIRDNEERIKAAEKRGNLPYFIRENKDDVDNVLHPKGSRKLILVSGKGDPLFDYIDDYNLPQSIRDRFEYYDSLKSFSDFKKHFSSLGIELTTDDIELLSKVDEHFESIAIQCRKLAIAHDTYTELLGKDCLKALKRINLFDEGNDMGSAQAAYFYNMIGEKDPWAGVLRIKTNNLNGHIAFHELVHAIQDSIKRNGEDAVMAASRIVKTIKLDDSVKAYFGASSSAMDAERMADAFANVFTRKKNKYEREFFERFMNKHQTNDIIAKEKTHYGAAMKLGRSATKEAMKIVENIGTPELTDIQKKNINELADALGITRKDVKPMSFLDADQGASNPTKDKENCQSVVVAFEARRRGLNCHALPYSANRNSESYALGERFQDAWINPKTNKIIEPTIIKGTNDAEIISKLKRQLGTDGRYVLGINENNGRGHLVSIERVNGRLIIKDDQINDFMAIDSLEDISYLEIIKIDKAILNISKIKSILGFN